MTTKDKNYLNNLNNKNNPEKHLTASALIINKECKVLLVKHKKLGVWLYPGGHVELHETPDETVIREVKEETGLDVKIVSGKDENLADAQVDVSVLHHPYAILCEKIPGDDEHYHIDMVYLCNMANKANYQLINNSESEEINFFGLEDLDKINLFPNFRRLLEKFFKEN